MAKAGMTPSLEWQATTTLKAVLVVMQYKVD
jgi:hypothetical protein